MSAAAAPLPARIRGLSLYRPWPWAILHAGKEVENRQWAPPSWMIGSYIALHAGRTVDEVGEAIVAARAGRELPPTAYTEGIVGIARLAGAVRSVRDAALTEEGRRWFVGPYGWLLRDVEALPEPIRRPGALGLWRLTVPELERLEAFTGRPWAR